MALVKYGGGVIQMSGSVAGNTFTRNRYGNYVRAKTYPVNPNSSSSNFARTRDEFHQNLIKAAFAMLSDRWSQILTEAQRTAWNLYGASVDMANGLGETINLSGYNHYMRSNMILAAAGGTLVDAGPTIFEIPEQDPSVAVTIEMHETRTNLTFDDTMEWVDEDGAVLWIFEGRPQNPQRNFFNGPWQGCKDKAGSSGDPKTSPEHFTHLQILTTGQRVWYKFSIQRADGRLSQPFYANSVVVAGPIP
ncbi:hypothetical protein ES703_65228 [subsurface metagenome]